MPAAIPGRVSSQVRINEDVYNKLKAIAKLENRSVNAQLEYFIKKGVEDYIQHNGALKPEAEQ